MYEMFRQSIFKTGTIKRVKEQVTDWEKIFVTDKPGKQKNKNRLKWPKFKTSTPPNSGKE